MQRFYLPIVGKTGGPPTGKTGEGKDHHHHHYHHHHHHKLISPGTVLTLFLGMVLTLLFGMV